MRTIALALLAATLVCGCKPAPPASPPPPAAPTVAGVDLTQPVKVSSFEPGYTIVITPAPGGITLNSQNFGTDSVAVTPGPTGTTDATWTATTASNQALVVKVTAVACTEPSGAARPATAEISYHGEHLTNGCAGN